MCELCRGIVVKRRWSTWECENERCQSGRRSGGQQQDGVGNGRWFYSFDMGDVPLEAIVDRGFVSWKGHALLEPEWAEELGGDCECLLVGREEKLR